MAVPSSRGCANGASGWIHSRPYFCRGLLSKKGEPAASGWIAEPRSWRNPGSVTSSVRVAPPAVAAASKTRTLHPASANEIAAASPLGPLPITAAHNFLEEAILQPRLDFGERAPTSPLDLALGARGQFTPHN